MSRWIVVEINDIFSCWFIHLKFNTNINSKKIISKTKNNNLQAKWANVPLLTTVVALFVSSGSELTDESSRICSTWGEIAIFFSSFACFVISELSFDSGKRSEITICAWISCLCKWMKKLQLKLTQENSTFEDIWEIPLPHLHPSLLSIQFILRFQDLFDLSSHCNSKHNY